MTVVVTHSWEFCLKQNRGSAREKRFTSHFYIYRKLVDAVPYSHCEKCMTICIIKSA